MQTGMTDLKRVGRTKQTERAGYGHRQRGKGWVTEMHCMLKKRTHLEMLWWMEVFAGRFLTVTPSLKQKNIINQIYIKN